MTTQATETGTETTLAAYEARIVAQIQDADTTLEKLEALAKDKRIQTQATAIATIKVARQTLEQKLRELATTSETHIARAKTEIDAAASALKTALDEFGRKLSTISGKKPAQE